MEIGVINSLVIDRKAQPGIFLVDAQGDDVLLPNRYVTQEMFVGDTLDVFVSTDSEDRLVASTELPCALRDEFGLVYVVDTTPHGAFVDWGLPKDLFVPKKYQKNPFRVGDKKIVRVILDEQTNRLVGDERIGRYLNKDVSHFKRFEEVELLVLASTPLGFKVIVNNLYEGQIFTNEIFESVYIGDQKKGIIKNIREDGKLDISLSQIGTQKKSSNAMSVYETLEKLGGKVGLTSKSEADDIIRVFGMSKKSFKAALTTLKEEGKITLSPSGIERV